MLVKLLCFVYHANHMLEKQLTDNVMCISCVCVCVCIICPLGILINKVKKEPFYETLVIKIITNTMYLLCSRV